MFNYKIVSVIFVCSLTIANSQQQEDNKDFKIGKYFYEKCYNETGRPDVPYNKLYNDTAIFAVKFVSAISSLPRNESGFCGDGVNQLKRRVKILAKDLEPCLKPNEKYLSDFIVDSFKEATHFLCDNDGENIKSLFSKRGANCRNNLSNFTASANDCFKKIFKPLHGYMAKKDLCEDIGVAEKCFAAALNDKCPIFYEYKELNEKFFKHISKPCRDSGSISQLNMLLLLLPMVLSYLFSKN